MPPDPPEKNFWKATIAAITKANLPTNRALTAISPIAPSAKGNRASSLTPTSMRIGKTFFLSLARPDVQKKKK